MASSKSSVRCFILFCLLATTTYGTSNQPNQNLDSSIIPKATSITSGISWMLSYRSTYNVPTLYSSLTINKYGRIELGTNIFASYLHGGVVIPFFERRNLNKRCITLSSPLTIGYSGEISPYSLTSSMDILAGLELRCWLKHRNGIAWNFATGMRICPRFSSVSGLFHFSVGYIF
jgi:hypothetical protein